jgi:hypothetical protein
MKKQSVQERLRVLEKEVAELKRTIPATNGKKHHWLEAITGSMAHVPEEDFKEFVRLGAEARKRVGRRKNG